MLNLKNNKYLTLSTSTPFTEKQQKVFKRQRVDKTQNNKKQIVPEAMENSPSKINNRRKLKAKKTKGVTNKINNPQQAQAAMHVLKNNQQVNTINYNYFLIFKIFMHVLINNQQVNRITVN